MKKIVIATGILTATSGAALAHPGDHHFSVVNSLIHLLTEPDHMAMMATVFVVAAAAYYKFKRKSV